MARAKNHLATLLHKVNRLTEAEALFLELRPTADSVDATDPVFAATMGNFALLLEDMGRLAEAEALARRARAIDEKLYGPDHPKVAVALNNLAIMMHRTKRSADAEPLARQSLELMGRVGQRTGPAQGVDVTRTKISWHRLPLDTRALADHVTALRCGLDGTLWERAESEEKCGTALKGSGYEHFGRASRACFPSTLRGPVRSTRPCSVPPRASSRTSTCSLLLRGR